MHTFSIGFETAPLEEHPLQDAWNCRIRWLSISMSLLTACLLSSACRTAVEIGTPEQRMICRTEARSNAFGSRNVEKLYLDCLRHLQDPKSGSSHDSGTLQKPTTSSVDQVDAYAHCVFNQSKIQSAYNKQHGLLGRIPHFEREFGYNHPRTLSAKAEYQAAMESLAELIPEPMREGLPLVPDAAEKFNACKRSEFGLS